MLLACGLCGAILSAASVTATGPADARMRSVNVSRAVLADPEGDVWLTDTRVVDGVPEPAELTTADLLGASARHGSRAVTARLRYVDLRRWGDAQNMYATIRTDHGKYSLFLRTTATDRRGRLSVMDHGAPHFGSTVRCRGTDREVSYAEDRVSMRVPRRCLGAPRWVRLRLRHLSIVDLPSDLTGEQYLMYADNPHNTGPYADGVFTPRLYRP